MTQQRALIVDADAHVVETDQTWQYMEASEKQYRPVAVSIPDGAGPAQQYWLVDGKVAGFRFPAFSVEEIKKKSEVMGRAFVTSTDSREMADLQTRLKHMDETGVDVQVLHNTMFTQPVTDKPAAQVALCRSYNRWLADIWKQGNGRFRWSCLAPMLNMTDALEEIRFAKQQGACAVIIHAVEGDRILADPYFYPVYDEASRLDMAMVVHTGNVNPWLKELFDHPWRRATTFHLGRAGVVGAFGDYLLSEIPDVFPKLRFSFIEAGAQWLPWMLNEVRDHRREIGRAWTDRIADGYRVYVSCENTDDIPYIIERVGDSCLVVGTDYGHFDHSSELDAIQRLKSRPDISDELKTRIISDNPRTLYSL